MSAPNVAEGLVGVSLMSKAERDRIIRLIPANGKFLELGTFHGVTAALIADTRSDLEIVCHDNWSCCGPENWQANRRPNMRMMTKEPRWYFDAVLVDADHSYHSVKRDLLRCRTFYLKKGGILFVHDYFNPPFMLESDDVFPIRMVTVCVNYDDLLALTLPLNARHFTEVVVVSSPKDTRTAKVVSGIANASLFTTDAFTRHGASFNKGLALEEAFGYMGRHGWMCHLDADTVLPDVLTGLSTQLASSPGCLWSAPRRLCVDPQQWILAAHTMDWRRWAITRDIVFPGYFHLWHADDPTLLPLPWGDLTFKHAGGSDGFFQSRWPKARKRRLPFEVLHLGPRDTNWFGRVSTRLDGGNVASDGQEMRAFRRGERSGKHQVPQPGRTKSCRWLPDDYPERVVVPEAKPRAWIHGEFE